MKTNSKRIVFFVSAGFMIVALYASTIGATPDILTPQNGSTNHPVVYPNTGQPIQMTATNQVSQTGGNPNLPPAYRGGISNLDDTIGTNAPKRGYNQMPQPTVTNHPDPTLPTP
jgi:hypothetical protein